jgi:hypothetical protein
MEGVGTKEEQKVQLYYPPGNITVVYVGESWDITCNYLLYYSVISLAELFLLQKMLEELQVRIKKWQVRKYR